MFVSSRRLVWVILGIAAVVSTSCASPSLDGVGKSQQALLNAGLDNPSDPDALASADVVVSSHDWVVSGGEAECSAVFITPTRLLTANHCITGADSSLGGGGGSGSAIPNFVDINVRLTTTVYGHQPFVRVPLKNGTINNVNAPIGISDTPHDFSILEVDDSSLNEATWHEILRLNIQRPSLQAPTTQPIFAAGYGRISDVQTGAEGFYPCCDQFGNYVLPLDRTIAALGGAYQLNGMWAFHQSSSGDPRLAHADSGGALFYLRSDGSRDVFGIASAGQTDGNGLTTSYWADLTYGTNPQWLNNNLVDSSANHKPNWWANHPFPQGHTNRWIGETDYTGACQSQDQDCDGWYDQNDNCPLDFNPTQADWDDDGIGDACMCPCDDANNHQDKDHDGFCATACPTATHPNTAPQVQDNCPMVNNPDQANCNYDAEIAQRQLNPNIAVLGDACDPVPCPESHATAITSKVNGSGAGNPQTGGWLKGRQIRDRIDTFGKPSYDVNCVSLGNPTTCSGLYPTDVTTTFRFCQYNPTDQTKASDCYDLNNIYDAAIDETDDRTHTIWHHISFKTYDPAAQAFGVPYTGSTTAFSLSWDYLYNQSVWLQANPATIPTPSNYTTCSDTTFGGDGTVLNSGVTCLSGRLWSHAYTDIGNTVTGQNGVTVGYHGAQLANHYFPDIKDAGLVDGHFNYVGGTPTTFYRPDGTYTWTYAGLGLWRPILLWKTLPDPWEVVTAPGHVAGMLVRSTNSTQLGVLQDDGTNALIPSDGPSAIVNPTLQNELRSSSYVWAANVDPSASMSTISGGVEGVALSTDGTSMLDVALNVGGVLKTRAQAGFPDFITRAGVVHPQARTGFTAFYSGAAGGVFMLGGSGLHDIWFRGMANDWWPIDAYTFDTLLAATYSFGDRKLYVLDHSVVNGTDTARLVRIDIQAGTVERLGAWPFTPVFTTYALVADADGTVLLAASNMLSTQIARLAVDTSGNAYATAIDSSEPASLVFNPVVDPGGYAITTTDPVSGAPVTRRYVHLPFGAPGTYTLDSFFPQPIANGGFETTMLASWTALGQSETVSTTSHSGSYGAMLGGSSPTNGDSTINQTFRVPDGGGTLKLWYSNVCPDTVYYDWFTAKLLNSGGAVIATIVPNTCASSAAWTQATLDLSAWRGANVTLVLTSHDDNYVGDATYTYVDDVSVN